MASTSETVLVKKYVVNFQKNLIAFVTGATYNEQKCIKATATYTALKAAD
jgi:hypothetical protein